MYGPDVTILLMYKSHDMRHTGFHRLTVVNETPGFFWVSHDPCSDSFLPRNNLFQFRFKFNLF